MPCSTRTVLLAALPLLCHAFLPGAAKEARPESAVVLQKRTRLVFQKDGTACREVNTVIRILTEAGVKELAILKVPYFTASQVLEVDHVRVRKPGGAVVETPSTNVQDLPAEVSRTAPMYSDIHEMNILVRGLAAGDTLEYGFRLRTVHPEVPGQFWFDYHRFPEVATQSEILELDAPGDLEVQVSSPAWRPVTGTQGLRRTWIWRTDVADPKARKAVRRMEMEAPSVQVSTFRSWQEVGSWWLGLQEPRAAVTPAIRAKAEELTRGLGRDEDRVRALYDYVARNFHYISISFGLGRYAPHGAEEVLENGYGDCKDKHTLLTALMKAVGLEAMPALVRAGGHVDPGVPTPGGFNHVITGWARGKEVLWLDTTLEVAPMGFLLYHERERDVLAMPSGAPAALVRIPANPAFPNASDLEVKGTYLEDGSFAGQARQSFTGDANLFIRQYFRTSPSTQWQETIKKTMEMPGYAWNLDQLETSAVEDTTRPFWISFAFTAGKGLGGGSYLIPFLPHPDTWAWPEKDAEDPLLLGYPGETRQKAEFKLPKGWVPSVPEPVTLTDPHAEYRSRGSWDKGMLHLERVLVVKSAEVPVADLARFRTFQEGVRSDVRRAVLVSGPGSVRGPKGGADAQSLVAQGQAAMGRGTFKEAEDLFRKASELMPERGGIRSLMGMALALQGRYEPALLAFQVDLEIDPACMPAEMGRGFVYARLGQPAKALEAGRRVLALHPPDPGPIMFIISAMLDRKSAPEASALLEEADRVWPGNTRLQASLGRALMGAGQVEKAVATYRAALSKDADALLLNDAAFDLADAGAALDVAQAWAEQAVHDLEARCAETMAGPASLGSLGAAWDTLGWVHFRRGDLDRAEAYLQAAWNLIEAAEGADHLGQLFQKRGKAVEAERMFFMATGCQGAKVAAMREHFRAVRGGDFPSRMTRPGHFVGEEPKAMLGQLRTFPLTWKPRAAGIAFYELVFTRKGLETVRFQGGHTVLKGEGDHIKGIRFGTVVPDEGPEKIVRKAILSCEGAAPCLTLVPLGGDWGKAATREPGKK